MSTTVRFARSIEVTRATTWSSGNPSGMSSFGIRTAEGMSAKRSSTLRRPISRSISSSSEGMRLPLKGRRHLRVLTAPRRRCSTECIWRALLIPRLEDTLASAIRRLPAPPARRPLVGPYRRRVDGVGETVRFRGSPGEASACAEGETTLDLHDRRCDSVRTPDRPRGRPGDRRDRLGYHLLWPTLVVLPSVRRDGHPVSEAGGARADPAVRRRVPGVPESHRAFPSKTPTRLTRNPRHRIRTVSREVVQQAEPGSDLNDRGGREIDRVLVGLG